MPSFKTIASAGCAMLGIAAATPMFHGGVAQPGGMAPPIAAAMFPMPERMAETVVPTTVAPLPTNLPSVMTVDTGLVAATFASLEDGVAEAPMEPGLLDRIRAGQTSGFGTMGKPEPATAPPLAPGAATAAIDAAAGPARSPKVPPPPREATADRATLEQIVMAEAEKRGVPADLARAHIEVESGWDARRKGADGKMGLMQVRPAIAHIYGFKGDDADLWSPATNVRYGMMFLAGAWKRADGDLCRTAMKIVGGHYVDQMKPAHQAYCERLKAALPAGSALAAVVPAAATPPAAAPASAPR